MKKTAMLGTLAVLTACVAETPVENTLPPAPEVPVEVTTSGVPCTYSCVEGNCATSAPEPLVLKPRVTETYGTKKVRRCCPEDKLVVEGETKVRIPDLPEIYVISANRTVNSMLNEATAALQKQTVKVYVADTATTAQDLPGGMDKGVKTIKKRLSNINTIIVTDNAKEAEYEIKSSVDWFDTPTKQVPAVKYTLSLESSDGVQIGEWTEVIHQTDGDRSWW